MDVHFELVECFFKVAVIRGKASDHDATQWVEHNLVGMGRQIILLLAKVIGHGNDRLATLFKAQQRSAYLF